MNISVSLYWDRYNEEKSYQTIVVTLKWLTIENVESDLMPLFAVFMYLVSTTFS